MKKDNSNNTIVSNKEKGKYSELRYQLLEVKENLSLVKINLITGRHHQIRVQFSSRGFPLYGDQRYGENNKKQLALFSYRLEFVHPVTKEKMIFEKKPNYGIFLKFKESL